MKQIRENGKWMPAERRATDLADLMDLWDNAPPLVEQPAAESIVPTRGLTGSKVKTA